MPWINRFVTDLEHKMKPSFLIIRKRQFQSEDERCNGNWDSLPKGTVLMMANPTVQ
jgi:hypothetical protein